MLPLSFCLFGFHADASRKALLLFLDLLAGQVFDRDFVELHALDGFCDFFFHLFPAGIILQAQFPHAGLGGGCT